MRLVFVVLCWVLAVGAGSAQPQESDARIAELRARIARRVTSEVGPLANRIADEALREGAPATASLALRLAGHFHIDQERLPEARETILRARDVARTHGLGTAEQAANLLLARVVSLEGRGEEAQALVMPALDVFDAQAPSREERLWAYAQGVTAVRATKVHDALLTRAVALLDPADRFAAACSLWQAWGDKKFNEADYGLAHEALTTALACYEALGMRSRTGLVLVSLGRVQRAHGQLDAALRLYTRAARLQEADGDVASLLQSLNAQAVTYDRLGQFRRAERIYRDALARARAARLARHEIFLRGNLAGSLLGAGSNAQALAELREVLREEKSPYLRAVRWRQCAEALRRLGRYEEGFAALTEARAPGTGEGFDERVAWLTTHASLLTATGQLDAAQRDLDEAVKAIEDARAGALAGDAARRGYGDLHQGVYAVAMDVAMRRGQAAGALELAEQARARALLDLMQEGAGLQAATPPDATAMQALATRLSSTLLVYWVGVDHTLAWVVGAERITAHRLPVGESWLRRWIQRAGGSGDVPGAINAALLEGPSLEPWRALHKAVIAPLAADLPGTPGSRLTIVPHGPLLHLPFAGLLDARGRYLIERHALHYAPSVAVLAAAVARDGGPSVDRALVVGAPAPLPRRPGVALPPPLPYAREEARRVARRLGAHAQLSTGSVATERAVRTQAVGATWLHVATHAQVSEEATAPSYLLLARGAGDTADDGVLTADEVRTLSLAGATVVLSACRTALGRVTGEGTLGFTRSFLAAGARAIVATTWEMPDDAGVRMMDAFYAAHMGGASVTEALRTAQLRQLRALRAGTLTRKVGAQVVRLPATPLLWAGYVAVGVP